MTTIILAEKPSQAMDYAKALGIRKKENGYIELESDIVGNAIVTWAIGHLVEMKTPKDYKEPVNTWNIDNLPYTSLLNLSMELLKVNNLNLI